MATDATPVALEPFFGGFIIETLTCAIGMYGEARNAIREYIQNSFDSVQRAIEELGTLRPGEGLILKAAAGGGAGLCLFSRFLAETEPTLVPVLAESVSIKREVWLSRLPKRRRGQRNSASAHLITAARQLVLIANDDLTAGILNRNGLVTGNGNHWTRERVTSLRSHHRIPVFKPAADGIEPWLNLSKAAQLLKIAPKTLSLAAEAGEIAAISRPSDG
jgi:hypothetical protein